MDRRSNSDFFSNPNTVSRYPRRASTGVGWIGLSSRASSLSFRTKYLTSLCSGAANSGVVVSAAGLLEVWDLVMGARRRFENARMVMDKGR